LVLQQGSRISLQCIFLAFNQGAPFRRRRFALFISVLKRTDLASFDIH
jgi:hypothetical protein